MSAPENQQTERFSRLDAFSRLFTIFLLEIFNFPLSFTEIFLFFWYCLPTRAKRNERLTLIWDGQMETCQRHATKITFKSVKLWDRVRIISISSPKSRRGAVYTYFPLNTTNSRRMRSCTVFRSRKQIEIISKLEMRSLLPVCCEIEQLFHLWHLSAVSKSCLRRGELGSFVLMSKREAIPSSDFGRGFTRALSVSWKTS